MFGDHPVRFRGPSRYCPECGRMLVDIAADGTVDLAPDAGFTARGEGDPEQEAVEGFVIDAECYQCHPELQVVPPEVPRFHWLWKQPKE